MSKLRVVVMTQNDDFFIPMNILKASKVCEIQEIVVVNCKSSLTNKYLDYYKWFGAFQCFKMAVLSVWRKVQKLADKLFKHRIFNGTCSVKDAAEVIGTVYSVIPDSNDRSFVEHMRSINPDLIISYSAPQVIRAELLSVPKHGIINVHGSLLPDIRGCLPSFWHLYCQEKYAGATVHYMSDKIDDGRIIKQERVDISDCKTMFQVIQRTKQLGGELMVEALLDIEKGNVNSKPNDTTKGRYFTWPTVEQAKEFRKKGYRLI